MVPEEKRVLGRIAGELHVIMFLPQVKLAMVELFAEGLCGITTRGMDYVEVQPHGDPTCEGCLRIERRIRKNQTLHWSPEK